MKRLREEKVVLEVQEQNNIDMETLQGGYMPDPNAAEDIVCEICGCRHFKEVYVIKKFSKLLTGSAKDSVVPLSTFACANCGHVNDELDIAPQKPGNSSKSSLLV